MTVVDVGDFGTFKVWTGTISEVSNAMKGTNMKNGSKIFWNGTDYTGVHVN